MNLFSLTYLQACGGMLALCIHLFSGLLQSNRTQAMSYLVLHLQDIGQ